MALSINRAFGIFPEVLRLEGMRAQTLASNIANADTPGYKARDIDFRQALDAADGKAGGMRLQRTDPAHMEPAGIASQPSLLYQVPSQPSLDGNTVDLQHNQAEFAQTALQYEAALTFLNGRIRTLRLAIKGQ